MLPVFLSMTVVAGGPSCHARGGINAGFCRCNGDARAWTGGTCTLTALIAWFVVDRLGVLGLLRKAWINLGCAIWAAALIPTGCLTLVA